MIVTNLYIIMFYCSDDSAPGAIAVLPDEKNHRHYHQQQHQQQPQSLDESSDTLMKRYLQCPGMCRIEVLKKFVQNKYNVNTGLFHVSIGK